MTSITSLGTGSGLDLETLLNDLVIAEGAPAAFRLDVQEATLQAELSALGSFRSALDSFRTALEPLTDLESFTQRLASSSHEELFTVSADTSAVTGSFQIEVLRLAQAQKLRSDAFVDPTAHVGTGTLTITVDGESMVLEIDDESATLAAIRDAINASEDNPGVEAAIINGDDGSHLVLTTSETGAQNTITVTASGGDGGLDALVYDPDGSGTENLTEIEQAQDAEVLIDGISVQSASNTISGAIDGVVLELVAAEPGTQARLDVELDKDESRRAIENFVTVYNNLITTLNDLTAYDPETQIAGALQGDSTVRLFQDQLRSGIGSLVDGLTGPFQLLTDIGISTNFEDGTLEIDAEKLDAALDSNFDAVGALFASEDGYAVRLDALAEIYIGEEGFIEVRTEGIEESIEDISERRELLDAHLIAFEARMREQFIALDLLIAELTATSEFLTQQLALLPDPDTVLKLGQ